MDRVFSREALAEIDRLCVERFGLPTIVLMENAASGVARLALSGGRCARVLIVCGPGNNGGDGLAAARHLSNAGVEVRVVLAGPRSRLSPDAATNLGVVRAMGIPTSGEGADAAGEVAAWRGDLVIDALLGTGVSGPVRPGMGEVIEAVSFCAAGGTPVLSIDVPSGLDCDTGEPLGVAVRATMTASLVGRKRGFRNPGSVSYTGLVECVGIGVPEVLLDALADH